MHGDAASAMALTEAVDADGPASRNGWWEIHFEGADDVSAPSLFSSADGSMDIPARYTPPAGLCDSCANVRIVVSGKGSRFYLCQLSAVDPAFRKYPPIPVIRCRGYRPAEATVVPEEATGE
ncbi:MAG TPA: hypothetical protein VFE05_00240 [Longimicrobiaceae bacterium]|jgi:hypothetical protein|nr:hypothetical protein [Longimicrobiaceae bacterium]